MQSDSIIFEAYIKACNVFYKYNNLERFKYYLKKCDDFLKTNKIYKNDSFGEYFEIKALFHKLRKNDQEYILSLQKALDIYLSDINSLPHRIFRLSSKLSSYYLLNQNFKESLKYVNIEIEYLEKLKLNVQTTDLGHCLHNRGICNFKLQDYMSSYQDAIKAHDFFKKIGLKSGDLFENNLALIDICKLELNRQ